MTMSGKGGVDSIVADMKRAVRGVKRAGRGGSELQRALRHNDSYSRAEVLALGQAFPTRGPLCHKCGLRIPEFADLNSADCRRVRALIRQGRKIMATRELQTITGCSLRWATLWVHHAGRPLALRPGPPCPFCRLPLKNSRAQLCHRCMADLHGDPARDPDEARVPLDPAARCYPRDVA